MIELLALALNPNTTKEQRIQAEAKIIEYRAQQPAAFLKENVVVFASNAELTVRQGAFALLRRSITEKVPPIVKRRQATERAFFGSYSARTTTS